MAVVENWPVSLEARFFCTVLECSVVESRTSSSRSRIVPVEKNCCTCSLASSTQLGTQIALRRAIPNVPASVMVNDQHHLHALAGMATQMSHLKPRVTWSSLHAWRLSTPTSRSGGSSYLPSCVKEQSKGVFLRIEEMQVVLQTDCTVVMRCMHQQICPAAISHAIEKLMFDLSVWRCSPELKVGWVAVLDAWDSDLSRMENRRTEIKHA
eukprot:scaffold75283_cov23-Tisochrysis_lutea.AAC.1